MVPVFFITAAVLFTAAISTWIKRTLWVVAGLGLVAAIVYAWMPEPVSVDAGSVQRGELVVTVDEDGHTRFDDSYVVSSPLGGTVSRIELEPGDRLQRGAFIARVSSPKSPLLDERSRETAGARVEAARAGVRRAEAGVRAARMGYDYAREELKRQKELVEGGITTRQQLERAQFEARVREAELESARAALQVARHELKVARTAVESLEAGGETRGDDTSTAIDVTAPIDGVVLEVFRESEGVIQAGTRLLEIGRPESLEVVADVLTTDAVAIERGARVVVERWGGDRILYGRVRRVEPNAFTKISSLGVEEQRVNVVIDPAGGEEEKAGAGEGGEDGEEDEDAGWGRLGDGYRVEVRIVIWQGAEVLKVDSSAVFRRGDGWAVFRIDEGVARLTPVEIGRRTDREVQILGGLEEGQPIVLYPSDAVEDGKAVEQR